MIQGIKEKAGDSAQLGLIVGYKGSIHAGGSLLLHVSAGHWCVLEGDWIGQGMLVNDYSVCICGCSSLPVCFYDGLLPVATSFPVNCIISFQDDVVVSKGLNGSAKPFRGHLFLLDQQLVITQQQSKQMTFQYIDDIAVSDQQLECVCCLRVVGRAGRLTAWAGC